MTIGAYLLILRRHWVAVVVMTLVGLGAGFGITEITPKVYTATTTQFVRGVPGTSATADYQAAQFATSRAKSYSALIGNPDVLSGVIDQLGLKMTPGELYSRLTVDNPTDTVLINVTARGTSPTEAQSISIAAADNLAKLIIRLESAGAAGGKSPIDVQTAVPASLPTSPSAPRPALNLAVGMMAGLALGSILALLLDARHTRRALAAAPDRRRRRRLRKAPEADPADPADAADAADDADDADADEPVAPSTGLPPIAAVAPPGPAAPLTPVTAVIPVTPVTPITPESPDPGRDAALTGSSRLGEALPAVPTGR